MSFLEQATLFLLAAVILVPIFKRIGLGAVLGYLSAGILIGPYGWGFFHEVEHILHFAELGVVLLLFIIGLELQPKRLWIMRKSILGLGGLQILITTITLSAIIWWLAIGIKQAIIIGFILSLSSTAFALQLLGERGELTTRHGRSAFSVLLFQDLAVIPALAIIPLLSVQGPDTGFSASALIKVLAIMIGVVIGGRYLLYYVLRWIAQTRIQEVFTAMALLTVVGTALLMETAGLSMALGAFLAGVLLAESEYRHALEADIEPFKGILLGLFFISVGMSLNLSLFQAQWLQILLLMMGLMAVKFIVLVFIGKLSGQAWDTSLRMAAVLAQGGEFAFVLFTAALSTDLLARETSELLTVVVTLSMAATPFVYMGVERLLRQPTESAKQFDDIPEQENQVIIAGFGRVGQIVARILKAKGIPFTAMDNNPENVDLVRRYGNRIYYGDASRLELLRAAKADNAILLVLAIGDVETSIKTAEVVREHYPDLKILARARNRKHAYRLMDLGIDTLWRETFYSSLEMAQSVLEHLGLSEFESQDIVQMFKKHDIARLKKHHHEHNDEEKMMYLAKQSAQELEEILREDKID